MYGPVSPTVAGGIYLKSLTKKTFVILQTTDNYCALWSILPDIQPAKNLLERTNCFKASLKELNNQSSDFSMISGFVMKSHNSIFNNTFNLTLIPFSYIIRKESVKFFLYTFPAASGNVLDLIRKGNLYALYKAIVSGP